MGTSSHDDPSASVQLDLSTDNTKVRNPISVHIVNNSNGHCNSNSW